MNLSDIGGIELNNSEKQQLKGAEDMGDNEIWCVSCKDSGQELIGNIEYEGELLAINVVPACIAAGHTGTVYITGVKKGTGTCDPV